MIMRLCTQVYSFVLISPMLGGGLVYGCVYEAVMCLPFVLYVFVCLCFGALDADWSWLVT